MSPTNTFNGKKSFPPKKLNSKMIKLFDHVWFNDQGHFGHLSAPCKNQMLSHFEGPRGCLPGVVMTTVGPVGRRPFHDLDKWDILNDFDCLLWFDISFIYYSSISYNFRDLITRLAVSCKEKGVSFDYKIKYKRGGA